jgi:hypothetical protein
MVHMPNFAHTAGDPAFDAARPAPGVVGQRRPHRARDRLEVAEQQFPDHRPQRRRQLRCVLARARGCTHPVPGDGARSTQPFRRQADAEVADALRGQTASGAWTPAPGPTSWLRPSASSIGRAWLTSAVPKLRAIAASSLSSRGWVPGVRVSLPVLVRVEITRFGVRPVAAPGSGWRRIKTPAGSPAIASAPCAGTSRRCGDFNPPRRPRRSRPLLASTSAR